jgi:hypothetical protein
MIVELDPVAWSLASTLLDVLDAFLLQSCQWNSGVDSELDFAVAACLVLVLQPDPVFVPPRRHMHSH